VVLNLASESKLDTNAYRIFKIDVVAK